MKLYVLKDKDGRYVCNNIYLNKEEQLKFANASLFDDLKDAKELLEILTPERNFSIYEWSIKEELLFR